MQLVVNPCSQLRGKPVVPGDKSISHRALMLAAIADGVSTIDKFLPGEDCIATLQALQAMGVTADRLSPTSVRIHGRGIRGLEAAGGALDMGNSGTAMRLLSGILAAQPFVSKLTGDASLRGRPMGRIIAPLEMMGAIIRAHDGKPPLEISGTTDLQSIDYDLPVASAQVKSAVLLAGLYANGTTRVTEPAITRDHTERMLTAMGVKLECTGRTISIKGGQQPRAADLVVPADLSSAAFMMLAATITPYSDVLITNVGINPTRTGVIDILRQMGADITVSGERKSGSEPVADLRVRSAALKGIDVDPALVSLAIDEFPVLFVAAAFAAGTTRFSGIGELRVKESDRIASMAAGLATLGVSVRESADGAEVDGGQVSGGVVDSFDDHRVAMSLAIAGCAATGPVTVRNADNIDTSFPGFVDVARLIGMDISRGDSALPNQKVVPVIAIDGPSGSGKGTIARQVANTLGWHLLDSGALYRLTAVAVAAAGEEGADDARLAQIAASLDVRFATDDDGEERIYLDGADVTAAVRHEDTGLAASKYAASPAVREALLALQTGFRRLPGLVADGRDMGTQVFPDAGLKVFLTASAEERARRRHKQLKDKGIDVSLPALSRDIEARDRRDSERSVAPLRAADDAKVLDSSDLTIDEVVEIVLGWAGERFP